MSASEVVAVKLVPVASEAEVEAEVVALTITPDRPLGVSEAADATCGAVAEATGSPASDTMEHKPQFALLEAVAALSLEMK